MPLHGNQAVGKLPGKQRGLKWSSASRSCEADLDPPRCDLGVLLLAHEVDLGRPDVGMTGELPHFVHGGPVTDGIVDRCLA